MEIFQLDFMVRAFIAGGVIGLVAPTLGTFLVLRRLSLIAETLAHVALAGAAVGLLLGNSPVLTAVIASASAAMLIEWLRSANRLTSDSALALVLYTALAVALVLISLGNGPGVYLLGFLFGSIVTVSTADVWATVILGICALAFVWLQYSELVQTSFDPDLARVSGVPVRRTNMLLAVFAAVTVTLSMRVVGALLVGALIVFPVLASLTLNKGFRTTLVVASLIGFVSVLAGLTLSYYQDVAASGAIVLMAVASLIGAYTLRGLLSRKQARAGSSSAR